MSIMRIPTKAEYEYIEHILNTEPVTVDNMDLYIPAGLRAAAYLKLVARGRLFDRDPSPGSSRNKASSPPMLRNVASNSGKK